MGNTTLRRVLRYYCPTPTIAATVMISGALICGLPPRQQSVGFVYTERLLQCY